MAANLAELQTSPTKSVTGSRRRRHWAGGSLSTKNNIVAFMAAWLSAGAWPPAEWEEGHRKSQPLHLMEHCQRSDPLKTLTPEQQQITNRWRESQKRSSNEASAHAWRRPCPAELSRTDTGPGPDGCEGHQGGAPAFHALLLRTGTAKQTCYVSSTLLVSDLTSQLGIFHQA